MSDSSSSNMEKVGDLSSNTFMSVQFLGGHYDPSLGTSVRDNTKQLRDHFVTTPRFLVSKTGLLFRDIRITE